MSGLRTWTLQNFLSLEFFRILLGYGIFRLFPVSFDIRELCECQAYSKQQYSHVFLERNNNGNNANNSNKSNSNNSPRQACNAKIEHTFKTPLCFSHPPQNHTAGTLQRARERDSETKKDRKKKRKRERKKETKRGKKERDRDIGRYPETTSTPNHKLPKPPNPPNHQPLT